MRALEDAVKRSSYGRSHFPVRDECAPVCFTKLAGHQQNSFDERAVRRVLDSTILCEISAYRAIIGAMLKRSGATRWILFAILLSTALEIRECDLSATVIPRAAGLDLSSGTSSTHDSADCCARPGACTCCLPLLVMGAAPVICLAGDTGAVALIAISEPPGPQRPRIDHPPRI
jgi:hypothetical protein